MYKEFKLPTLLFLEAAIMTMKIKQRTEARYYLVLRRFLIKPRVGEGNKNNMTITCQGTKSEMTIILF